jgi:arylsulfatase A-like enzyme
MPTALLLLALLASSRTQEDVRDEGRARPSIVLIVLDDFGVDKLRAYHEGPPGIPPPCTPRLDALAAEGLLFRNVWANPTCSPARAQILTGRHGFRTGIGKGIGANGRSLGLRVDLETTLPRALVGYESSALGKWHLMSPQDGDENHPLEAGFRFYSGSLFNLGERKNEGELCPGEEPLGYSNWVKTSDPEGSGRLSSACCRQYATTVTADEAIARARAMEPPWFLYVAFNAIHWPFEPPPAELTPPGRCPDQYGPTRSDARGDLMNAMAEALDTEIGRLLDGVRAIDPGVLVFVIGDNGSELGYLEGNPEDCYSATKGKSTLFEGGVRVPLIAAGPGIEPGECRALVGATDLFATLTELSGHPLPAEDSVSLVPYLRGKRRPLRETVYAELFSPNQPSSREGRPFAPLRHMRAVRTERFKLVRVDDGRTVTEQLFDLANDPCEARPVCSGSPACEEEDLESEALAGYRRLKQELSSLGVY